MLKSIEKKFLYYPINTCLEPISDEIHKCVQEVFVDSTDNIQLHCWHIKAEADKPTILFCHGQGENKSMWQNVMKHFSNLGFGVLMMDFRAHGVNQGIPSETNFYNDLKSTIKYLQHNGIQKDKIILWGRSLGGAIVAEIASKTKQPFHSVILESTFTNMKEEAIHVCQNNVMQNKFNFFSCFIKKFAKIYPYSQKFETDKKIHLINSPLFIGHSKPDEIAPVNMAYTLSKLNQNAYLYISETGDHDTNDWIFEEVKKFINR